MMGLQLLIPWPPPDPYWCYSDLVREWARNHDFVCLSGGRSGFPFIAILFMLWLCYAIWISSAAAPIDRFLVLWGRLWSGIPVILTFGTILVLWKDFEFISLNQTYILLGLAILLLPFWDQISSPIIRKWLYRRAKDIERIQEAERRGTWPMALEEWRDVEIEIAPRVYIGLLVGTGALLFVIVETVLSEFLENTFGLSGYVGSSVIALAVGLIVYPVHGWTSRRVKIVQAAALDSDEETNVKSWQDVLRKWVQYWKLYVKYWYVIPLSALAGVLYVAIMR